MHIQSQQIINSELPIESQIKSDNKIDSINSINSINLINEVKMDINSIVEKGKNHFCYILKNNCPTDINRTYNGYTVDPNKRLRQHNQEIKGGAIYTKTWGNKTWKYIALISGFPDKYNALQCEWRIKHPAAKRIRPQKYNNPSGRIIGLNEILKLEKWTSKSGFKTSDLRLKILILKEYRHLLKDCYENIEIIAVDEIIYKS